ncbi:MAG: hypothetical protein ACRBBV_03690 [Paracoccaceae bacterium]
MDLLIQAWEKLAPIHTIVYSVLISLFTAFLLWLFRAKVKLVWGSTSSNYHRFKITEGGNQIAIWTEKFYVQNSGRKPAEKVELVFSSLLTSYNLWPPREHTSKLLENGNFIISIPSIAPRETVIVDMIDIENRKPTLLSVNCPSALSKPVAFYANRQYGPVVNALVAYLMLAGFIATINVALRLLVAE